jgi:MFS family permease
MFVKGSILAEAPRPEAVRRHPRAPWFAVGVVCSGAFMGQLDVSIVTLTFRPMMREFHAPLAAMQWVSLIYLLTLVALLAPAGRISDARGRKLVYTYGFGVFTAASAACGLAPGLTALVAFRLVQAAGAAMLQANSVALVTTSVPKAKMRLALGMQAGAQSLGLALGPTLGGLITVTVGWRFVYWFNVPVGIMAVVAARYLLPRTRDFGSPGRFDWQGTSLLAVCTAGLLLALSAAGGLSMPGWAAAGLALSAIAAGAGFAVHEARARFPVIPLTMLRSKGLARALAGAVSGYLVLFGPLVLVPQVLGTRPGGEAGVGLLLSALPAGFGVAALTADTVLPPYLGNRQRGMLGSLISALALGLFAVLPPGTSLAAVLLGLTGLGLGIFIPANNAAIMRSAPGDSAATLGGLVNMARAIGTTLGIAMVTWVLHLAAGGTGTDTARDPSPLAFGVLALAALASAATTLAGHREEASDGHRPREVSAAHIVCIQPGTQPRRSRIRPDRTVRYSGAHRRRSGRWRSVSLLARPAGAAPTAPCFRHQKFASYSPSQSVDRLRGRRRLTAAGHDDR